MFCSVCCWGLFFGMNTLFLAIDACCIVKPQGGAANYYSFDFDPVDLTDADKNQTAISFLLVPSFNVYSFIYTPLGKLRFMCLFVCVLSL